LKNDLLALLLRARDDATGAGMTEEQLHNETITAAVSGHETTGQRAELDLVLACTESTMASAGS